MQDCTLCIDALRRFGQSNDGATPCVAEHQWVPESYMRCCCRGVCGSEACDSAQRHRSACLDTSNSHTGGCLLDGYIHSEALASQVRCKPIPLIQMNAMRLYPLPFKHSFVSSGLLRIRTGGRADLGHVVAAIQKHICGLQIAVQNLQTACSGSGPKQCWHDNQGLQQHTHSSQCNMGGDLNSPRGSAGSAARARCPVRCGGPCGTRTAPRPAAVPRTGPPLRQQRQGRTAGITRFLQSELYTAKFRGVFSVTGMNPPCC